MNLKVQTGNFVLETMLRVLRNIPITSYFVSVEIKFKFTVNSNHKFCFKSDKHQYFYKHIRYCYHYLTLAVLIKNFCYDSLYESGANFDIYSWESAFTRSNLRNGK